MDDDGLYHSDDNNGGVDWYDYGDVYDDDYGDDDSDDWLDEVEHDEGDTDDEEEVIVPKNEQEAIDMGQAQPKSADAEAAAAKDRNVPAKLLKPGKEEDLVLKKLLPDHWEDVLGRLSSRDLLSLMLASKAAKAVVDAYVLHYVTSNSRLENAMAILASPSSPPPPPPPAEEGDGQAKSPFPLLLREKALKLKLDKLDSSVAGPTLVHLKAADALTARSDGTPVRRACVRDADDFPHLGNPSYIVAERDDAADRQVVRLKSVCWLLFRKDFELEGENADGRYEFSLRMKTRPGLSWPDARQHGGVGRAAARTHLRVLRKEGQGGKYEEMMDEEMDPSWWNLLSRRQFKQSEHLKHSRIVFDPPGSEWFTFKLDPVELEDSTADTVLAFEFRDVDNPWWKSGLYWDFIQLRKL